MDNKNCIDGTTITDYVKSLNLKGKISFEDYGFVWNLGNLELKFIFDSGEVQIDYSAIIKNKSVYVGHLHVVNEDVIDMISEINREDKTVKITYIPLISTSSFQIADKTAKRKKSGFFVRRYYSD